MWVSCAGHFFPPNLYHIFFGTLGAFLVCTQILPELVFVFHCIPVCLIKRCRSNSCSQHLSIYLFFTNLYCPWGNLNCLFKHQPTCNSHIAHRCLHVDVVSVFITALRRQLAVIPHHKEGSKCLCKQNLNLKYLFLCLCCMKTKNSFTLPRAPYEAKVQYFIDSLFPACRWTSKKNWKKKKKLNPFLLLVASIKIHLTTNTPLALWTPLWFLVSQLQHWHAQNTWLAIRHSWCIGSWW